MEKELYILWTNDNPITTEKMVLMYGHNALIKDWWEKVTVIVWGATAVLAAENKEVRVKIKEMLADGVRFVACKACADGLEVSERLEEIGIEVFYTGEFLTDILQNNKKLLTV